MDLVTLVTLCSVAFDPGLMHALISVESEGRPWSFRVAGGEVQSFGNVAEAVVAARIAQADGAAIRVGLAGLRTDLFAAASHPNAAVFEPCPNVVLVSLRLGDLVQACRRRTAEGEAELCALAVYRGSWEAPDLGFASEVMMRSAVGNLPNPEMPSACECVVAGPESSDRRARKPTARDAENVAIRTRNPSRNRTSRGANSSAIFVPLSRDR